MATEKVGIYRKYHGPIPTDRTGKPLPKSEWPRRRVFRWAVRWFGSDGKRYSKSFKTRKEAERFASEVQRRVCTRKADKPQDITLQQFRFEHGQVMKGQVAYATLDDQKRALKLFEKYIGGAILLSKIKPRHAEAFVAYRLTTVSSVATVNKDIRTLRRIFNLAIEPRGYLEDGQNPFTKIKERKTTDSEIRYVEPQECRALMENAASTWWQAFLSVAYGSGLRRNEILHLMWKNINFENQLIKVVARKRAKNILEWESKGHKNRIVPMSDETSQLLANLQLQAEEGFPYVFISAERFERIRERQRLGNWNPRCQVINNLDRSFQVIRCRASIDECVIHDLRRSAITNWAKRLPIHVVQRLAGHSDIRTTQRYYLAVQECDLEEAKALQSEILGSNLTDPKLTHSKTNGRFFGLKKKRYSA